MKKFLLVASLLAALFCKAQTDIYDPSTLRNRINTDIVTNNLKLITGAQLNKILNGIMNVQPSFSNGISTSGSYPFLTKLGGNLNQNTTINGLTTYDVIFSQIKNFSISSPNISFNLGSDATGDMYVRNSFGKLQRIAIGDSGQVLTVLNGMPIFSNPPGVNGAQIDSIITLNKPSFLTGDSMSRFGITIDTSKILRILNDSLYISVTGDVTFGYGTSTISNAAVTNSKLAGGIDAAKINTGIVSNTEFNYLDGVTSAIQTQLNGKLSNITGLISQGSNVTITGNGTAGSPYVINSTGGSFTDAGFASDLSKMKVMLKDTVNNNYVHANIASMYNSNLRNFDALLYDSINGYWKNNRPELTYKARGIAINDMLIDSSDFWVPRHPSEILTLIGAQPLDADLTSLAAASGTNTIYYRSAANTWSAITIGANLTFSGGTLSASGSSMVYPAAGIAVSTGSAWGTSITDNSANWNTAYTDRFKWDGGATGLNATTARTSLGLVIGTNVQAYNANLTTYAGIAPSANVQSLLGAADYAAMKTLLSLNNVENVAASTVYQTLANLSTVTTLGTSNTLYPSQNAVKTYVDNAVANVSGGAGLTNAYTAFTDGTNSTTSSGATTFKFRSANNLLSVVVADNDATHGDNLLLTFNQANITQTGTITSGVWNATAIADAYIASASTWNAKMSNPMTSLGDIPYGGASGSPSRLPGNTTTTRKFLTSLGNGTSNTSTTFDNLVAGDIPNLDASKITTGTKTSAFIADFNTAVQTVGDARYLQSYSESDPTVSITIKNIPTTADASTNKYLQWNNGNYARKQIDYSEIANAPGAYVLPILSTTVLGGAKVDGTTITANASGVISATSSAPDAANFISGATTGVTVVQYTAPDDAVYKIGTVFHITSNTGSLGIQLSWVDSHGASHVKNLKSVDGATSWTTTGYFTFPNIQIDAQAGTDISVVVTGTTGFTYDAGADIKKVYNIAF